ncbi:MAG TPA: glutamate--tRNA ligase family protein [Gemmatimonadaceae bacterium]|nr:glutamate--tRNA ligase family protein [Gemmatimonadaceae bacterium]
MALTRFAPAPTGYLHLGHVLNAIEVWRAARDRGGQVLLRVEDHDRARCRPEYEAAIREDLAWLGFVPDAEAPRQSERGTRYAEVLAGLEARGLAYPCACSRKDVAAVTGDAFNEESRYPGTCRDRHVDPASTPARRVRMEPGAESFTDLRLGPQAQSPADQCGDVLVRDRLGNWTYQFCVAVDDFDQGVTLVVRGEDLLASTGRQLRLARMIGRTAMPEFLHHGLLRKPGGAKLSKSDGDTGVRELREAGMPPAEVVARARRMADGAGG